MKFFADFYLFNKQIFFDYLYTLGITPVNKKKKFPALRDLTL